MNNNSEKLGSIDSETQQHQNTKFGQFNKIQSNNFDQYCNYTTNVSFVKLISPDDSVLYYDCTFNYHIISIDQRFDVQNLLLLDILVLTKLTLVRSVSLINLQCFVFCRFLGY